LQPKQRTAHRTSHAVIISRSHPYARLCKEQKIRTGSALNDTERTELRLTAQFKYIAPFIILTHSR